MMGTSVVTFEHCLIISTIRNFITISRFHKLPSEQHKTAENFVSFGILMVNPPMDAVIDAMLRIKEVAKTVFRCQH